MCLILTIVYQCAHKRPSKFPSSSLLTASSQPQLVVLSLQVLFPTAISQYFQAILKLFTQCPPLSSTPASRKRLSPESASKTSAAPLRPPPTGRSPAAMSVQCAPPTSTITRSATNSFVRWRLWATKTAYVSFSFLLSNTREWAQAR